MLQQHYYKPSVNVGLIVVCGACYKTCMLQNAFCMLTKVTVTCIANITGVTHNRHVIRLSNVLLQEVIYHQKCCYTNIFVMLKGQHAGTGQVRENIHSSEVLDCILSIISAALELCRDPTIPTLAIEF